MSCKYEHQFERIVSWHDVNAPITVEACLCYGQKNAPDCPYFLGSNQKDCPKYKEKISE